MKNKTIAVWLTFFLGPLGLHRLYLKGRMDALGWILPWPTLLGSYGLIRVRELGVDDTLSWLLIPLLGFTWAACALTAIVYGLMDTEKWNRLFNPTAGHDAQAGKTNWGTIIGMATAMFLGTTALMATIAFSFQHYFEYQRDAAAASVQSDGAKKSAD